MVIPQIYYPFPTYTTTLDAWSSKYAIHVPCLVGYPLYRIENPLQGNFPLIDFENMLILARGKSNILGGIYYGTRDFKENRKGANLIGAADVIRKYYHRPAVRPVAGRITERPPLVPENVTLTGTTLSWTAPADGLTSVVYLIPEGKQVSDACVVKITQEKTMTVTEKGTYLVTTFNRNNVESDPSKPVVF